MDETQKQAATEPNENPEEAALEKEALAETGDAAIRARVLERLALAEVPENEEYIQKLVEWQKEENKKLATAIKQKINYREKAQKPTPTAVVTPAAPKTNAEVPDVAALVDARLNERLDEVELSKSELPEEARKELKAYAKAQGITAREALSTPYFQFLKDREDAKKKEEDATISRTNKTPAKTAYSVDKPPQVDMQTEEGRAEWDNWLAWASKQ